MRTREKSVADLMGETQPLSVLPVDLFLRLRTVRVEFSDGLVGHPFRIDEHQPHQTERPMDRQWPKHDPSCLWKLADQIAGWRLSNDCRTGCRGREGLP